MSTIESKRVTLKDGRAVTLRNPTEGDAEALIAYLDIVRRETEFIMIDAEDDLPTLEAERAWVTRGNEGDGDIHIVGDAGGQIVAVAGIGRGRRRRTRHRGLVGVSALAAWCDCGLGTILMRELIAW